MAQTVAVIGTGKDPDDVGPDGFAMAYYHGYAYRDRDDCQLDACVDIVEENARSFAEAFDIDSEHSYQDHQTMLEAVEPDVISLCVPPAVHEPVVIDCAKQHSVEAIFCEKPMAFTWAECRRMAQECERRDVQLTFDHQRRFGSKWQLAKELLDDGVIGELERIEMAGRNLYDFGSHTLDLASFFNDDHAAEWVIGQIDYREEDVWFGAHNENQAFAQWRYENGVYGLISTGAGEDMLPALHRLEGTEGTMDVDCRDGPDLRYRSAGDTEWTELEDEGESWTDPIAWAIDDLIDSLDAGEQSQLCARNALIGTEIIFAAWESSRRRGRVDLPLTIADNPLEAMVQAGDLPVGAEESDGASGGEGE